jgi:PAS domain S-box-containing protein
MTERKAYKATETDAGKAGRTTRRRSAEERARLYEAVFNSAQIGLNVWKLEDPEDLGSFRFVVSNPAAGRITGLPREEVLGKTIAETHPAILQTEVPRVLAEVIRSGKARDLGAVRYGDERIRPSVFLAKAFPLPDNCVAVAFEDVTERKRAEEALRESEAKFRKLADTTAAAIVIYRGRRPLYFNTALEELTGYTREEILAKELWQFVHPDFQTLVRERSRARQAAEEVPSRYEIKIVRKDGEERWVDYTAGMTVFEGEPAALGTAYDITERKRAEEALRASEATYHTIFDAVSDAIVLHDAETGAILHVNAKFCEMFGYTPEEARGLNVEAFGSGRPPYVQEEALRWIRKAVQGETRFPDWRARDRAGRLFWVEASLRSVAIGGRSCVLAIARDITERKRREEALQKAREKLESKVERELQHGNPYGLTFRELTVLHLVAAGKTDRQVALELGISPLTVHKHLTNIFSKMSATSRTEAGVRALREGLLD